MDTGSQQCCKPEHLQPSKPGRQLRKLGRYQQRRLGGHKQSKPDRQRSKPGRP